MTRKSGIIRLRWSACAGSGPATCYCFLCQRIRTAKFSKVLRFIHSVPPVISNELDNWVAVPKVGINTNHTLFVENNDSVVKCCELALSKVCFLLKKSQRCADWFPLRHIRVTVKNTGLILQRDSTLLHSVSIETESVLEKTLKEWCQVFSDGWFSSKVSNEAMKRGTAN